LARAARVPGLRARGPRERARELVRRAHEGRAAIRGRVEPRERAPVPAVPGQVVRGRDALGVDVVVDRGAGEGEDAAAPGAPPQEPRSLPRDPAPPPPETGADPAGRERLRARDAEVAAVGQGGAAGTALARLGAAVVARGRTAVLPLEKSAPL